MSLKSGHILILEDEPTQRDVLAYNLASAGFRVAAAAEAAEAFRLALHTHYDLVVADYYLRDYPGTDFIALLRKIEDYERVPIILVTARAEELNLEYMREELSLLVIPKPYSMNRLLHTVSRCLAIAGCAS
ncbi:MAG: response regulator [Planctomycetota bacterium]|jgi:two-component system phosphate regulon response regulator PhoB